MTAGDDGRQRIVFLGSGAFGLPTFERLRAEHDVVLVVTQPDRPAGRRRTLTPTPIGAAAAGHGLPVFRPEDPNAPEAIATVHAARPDALVVIAYGHKLAPALLDDHFALNLHASLLPKYRGAAPINRAMMAGETETGVSVITLAQRMDAGAVLAVRATPIDPRETAGELHDRLAELGPDAVLETLAAHAAGTLARIVQDHAAATPAPKLRKHDGTVAFDAPADRVRGRIHGLTPWPGCTVVLDGERLKLLRVETVEVDDEATAQADETPGTLRDDGTVACRPGRLRLLEVQAPGGRPMPFADYRRGRTPPAGVRLEPLPCP